MSRNGRLSGPEPRVFETGQAANRRVLLMALHHYASHGAEGDEQMLLSRLCNWYRIVATVFAIFMVTIVLTNNLHNKAGFAIMQLLLESKERFRQRA